MEGMIPVAGGREEIYTGTTDVNGEFTVSYVRPYGSAPHLDPTMMPPNVSNAVIRPISNLTTGFTVKVEARATLSVLGLEVLASAAVPRSGQSVSVKVTGR